MPVFQYEALDSHGTSTNGEVIAQSKENAVEKIKESGLVLFSMNEKQTKRKGFLSAGEKKVTLTDLALFSRQLSAMLSAGIPITRAISTLGKQTPNQTLAKALTEIAENVEGGTTLTVAFSKYPKIFNDLYISMIRAGEIGGLLETTLMRLSNQLHKDKRLKDNIKSATSYPKMVGGFALILFFGMMVFMVPIFKGFAAGGSNIPAITAFIYAVSDSVRTKWYLWLLVLFGVFMLVYTFAKSKVGHTMWENAKMKMPVFGEIISKSVIARFSRTLSTLIDGGIPIVSALQTAGPTAGSDLIAQAVNEAIIQIEEGKNISTPLEESKLFPPMVTHMIAIGEEAGTLSTMLDKVAEFYEEDVESASKQLGAVLEPIILIAVGIIVGSMLIALYLPIFTAVINSAGLCLLL